MSFKKILLALPEYLLILAVMFYWLSAGLVINYIAMLLLAILIYQIFSKNKIVGLIIPSIFIFICLYMLLALSSEVSEFSSFNSEAKTLLFVGLAYFLGTISVCGLMIYKYIAIEYKSANKL